MSRNRPSLFVSYAHGAPGHKALARRLVGELRARGFQCVFDQDVSPSPPRGWARWMHTELRRANRVLIFWSPEYLSHFHSGEPSGADFEMTIVLKMAYLGLKPYHHFVPCVSRSTDVSSIDVLWRDHESFRLPRDTTSLIGHLMQGSGVPRATRKRAVRGIGVVPTKQIRIEPLARFVLSFDQNARAVVGGRRLDLLLYLREHFDARRSGRNGEAYTFIREVLEPLPRSQPARSLDLFHSGQALSLRHFPGHGRPSLFGDPVLDATVHEFTWRLCPGKAVYASGRLYHTNSRGSLLLGRKGGPPLLHIALRDLPSSRSKEFQDEPAHPARS